MAADDTVRVHDGRQLRDLADEDRCPRCDHPKRWHFEDICGIDCICPERWDQ